MRYQRFVDEMSYLDYGKMPDTGDVVWFLGGQMADKPMKGTVLAINNIDQKGLANTYMDIDSKGKKYHVNIAQVYDHMPKRIKKKDEYGDVTVWEATDSVVKKALSIPEPKVGGDYPSEKVDRYLELIQKALDQMKSAENNDANDSIVADLRDKKKKWSNVGKETEPAKTANPEEPPPEEGDGGEPPPEDQADAEAEQDQQDQEEEKAREEEKKEEEKAREEEEKEKEKERKEIEKERRSRLKESFEDGLYQCPNCDHRFDKPYVFEHSTFEELGPVCPKCYKRLNNEAIDKKLFALGREVNINLPHESGLKPSKEQFKKAAEKMGITVSKAMKAWNEFTWGE